MTNNVPHSPSPYPSVVFGRRRLKFRKNNSKRLAFRGNILVLMSTLLLRKEAFRVNNLVYQILASRKRRIAAPHPP